MGVQTTTRKRHHQPIQSSKQRINRQVRPRNTLVPEKQSPRIKRQPNQRTHLYSNRLHGKRHRIQPQPSQLHRNHRKLAKTNRVPKSTKRSTHTRSPTLNVIYRTVLDRTNRSHQKNQRSLSNQEPIRRI